MKYTVKETVWRRWNSLQRRRGASHAPTWFRNYWTRGSQGIVQINVGIHQEAWQVFSLINSGLLIPRIIAYNTVTIFQMFYLLRHLSFCLARLLKCFKGMSLSLSSGSGLTAAENATLITFTLITSKLNTVSRANVCPSEPCTMTKKSSQSLPLSAILSIGTFASRRKAWQEKLRKVAPSANELEAQSLLSEVSNVSPHPTNLAHTKGRQDIWQILKTNITTPFGRKMELSQANQNQILSQSKTNQGLTGSRDP